MRTSTASLVALTALASAAPAAAAVEVLPGVGLDDARLGMTQAGLEQALGVPAVREGDLLRLGDVEARLVAGRAARLSTGRPDAGPVPPRARCVGDARHRTCSVVTPRRTAATRVQVVDGRVARVSIERLTTALVPELPDTREVLLGRSQQGRPIRAVRVGDPESPRKALVVGAIHGDEPESPRPVRALRALPVRGVDLWLVDVANPDGLARGRRQTANGTDLNRNFGFGWRRTGGPGHRFYAGPSPFSAPESKILRDLVDLLRPAVSVWYHQPYGYVIEPVGGDHAIVRRYARLAGMRAGGPRGERAPGQVTSWQNAAYPGTTAFIAELPAAALPATAIRRHARAALAVARGRR